MAKHLDKKIAPALNQRSDQNMALACKTVAGGCGYLREGSLRRILSSRLTCSMAFFSNICRRLIHLMAKYLLLAWVFISEIKSLRRMLRICFSHAALAFLPELTLNCASLTRPRYPCHGVSILKIATQLDTCLRSYSLCPMCNRQRNRR